MDDRLSRLSADLLHAATRAGAEAADALVMEEASLSADVRSGALEHAERSESIEIGLRVLIGRRQACVSASDTRPETMARMAERAVAMAREAPEDPGAGLAEPGQLSDLRNADALDLFDPSGDPAPAALAEAALRAEAAALAVARVSQVDSSSAGFSRDRVHLAATNGFTGGYARTRSSLSCVAISGEGTAMERDWMSDARVYSADLMAPEEIGRIAGERAVRAAGPRRAKSGAFPVIYDERVASSLIGHLLAATNGALIARGSSWARDLAGEIVLPPDLTLSEEPHRPRVSASRPFDAEGLPTAPRDIVKDGVLTGWTLDLSTARKLGLASTGNAARSAGSPPSPAVGNVTLTQGSRSREDLLAEMGTGLLVTSMIGSTINPNTGDYSRGASGFWIENGEIAYPVNEITLAGNLIEMLKTIVPANDARTHLARVIPSLRVEGLFLAGD
ncbi:PmbA protein [Palleronia aestuarii]|uniref:PmbA protein n=1 Tax=Palleronia aestuarii TaxID=568105 RepID=A0A2W7NIL0_9RHOB|nr:TldD/PmbA family protein [Palleronia aestuarii]PZX16524.1 PmbA protein [Palleronia aestuarii]